MDGRVRKLAVAATSAVVIAGATAIPFASTSTNSPRRVPVVGSGPTTTVTIPSDTTTPTTLAPTTTTTMPPVVTPRAPVTTALEAPTTVPTTAVLTTPPTTVAAAPPIVTAAPDTNLPERGWVTVAGSGFTPSGRVFVIECVVGVPDTSRDCDSQDWWDGDEAQFFTDDAGNISPNQERPIRRVLGDGTDCASVPAGCELRVIWNGAPARTPISFAGPPGPMIPMTLHVDPSTGLVDGQTVHVSGTYFMPGGENLEECAQGCTDLGPEIRVAGDGTFDTMFTVARTFTIDERSFDCAVVQCTISTGQALADRVPISFAGTAAGTGAAGESDRAG